MHVFILVKWCLQIKIIEVGTHVTHPRYGHCAVPQQFGRYEAHHTSGNISKVINGVATHSDSEMIRVDFWGELATHNHCIYMTVQSVGIMFYITSYVEQEDFQWKTFYNLFLKTGMQMMPLLYLF